MSLLKKRSCFLAITALCSAAMGAAASFLSAGLGQAGNAIPTALFGGAAALFGLELALVLAALGLFLGRAGVFLNLPSGPLAGSAGAEASCEEPALV